MNRPQDRLLPVVVHAPQDSGQGERPGRLGDAGSANPYAAQMLGQGGQKRGLRGGPPVLDAARAAYLEAEYSGEHDRRPPSGLLIKAAI